MLPSLRRATQSGYGETRGRVLLICEALCLPFCFVILSVVDIGTQPCFRSSAVVELTPTWRHPVCCQLQRA
jgi:hypothetical protein